MTFDTTNCLDGQIPLADGSQVDWLVQPISAHPALTAGNAPVGLLGSTESARLAKLTIPKRRRDWLLGRWTAKHLLQEYLRHVTHTQVPLDALAIGNDPDGAPFATLRSRLPVSLSISHSGAYSFCAVAPLFTHCTLVGAPAEKIEIGADIERIEHRGREFVADFFTGDELTQVDHAPEAFRDTLVTIIWSAKEAMLKALRLGLTVDTRCIDVEAIPLDTPTHTPAHKTDWAAMRLGLAPSVKLPMASAPVGWWRIMDGYVLTLAVLRHAERLPMSAAV
ncbi:MAG: 4'-phosphopantetheinyl transferase superfamily protein [Anaerolineae bacterium]